MADAESNTEQRTEQPTEKRLRDARERGQVPRSRELSMALVTLSGAACLMTLRPYYAEGIDALFVSGLDIAPAVVGQPDALLGAFNDGLLRGLKLLAPLLVTVIVAGLASAAFLGGWTFSAEPLVPKLEKLNPIEGLKRVFGWNGLIELGKALAKFLLVAACAAVLISVLAEQFLGLGRLPIGRALAQGAYLCAFCFLALAGALLLIAAVDVPLQLWQFRRRMRMSRQELKDEHKETEGRPEVRSRIRSMQQELATRRMMEDVKTADVVATNPTHYAVALRYDAKSMKAPRVVAKGTDLIALTIRNVATAHAVPIFEHPMLARALYRTTKIGMEIPPRLYLAVAQVLTYVYSLRDIKRKPGRAPSRPHIEIEPDLAAEPRAARPDGDP